MTREDFTDEEYALLRIMFNNMEQTINELRFFGLEIDDIDLLNLVEKVNLPRPTANVLEVGACKSSN